MDLTCCTLRNELPACQRIEDEGGDSATRRRATVGDYDSQELTSNQTKESQHCVHRGHIALRLHMANFRNL